MQQGFRIPEDIMTNLNQKIDSLYGQDSQFPGPLTPAMHQERNQISELG